MGWFRPQALSWLAAVHVSWWHGFCGLNGSCKESRIQAGQHPFATGGFPSFHSSWKGTRAKCHHCHRPTYFPPPCRPGRAGLASHPEASSEETRIPGHPNNGPVQPCGSFATFIGIWVGSPSFSLPAPMPSPTSPTLAQLRELLTMDLGCSCL